jgi:hypothetical protein
MLKGIITVVAAAVIAAVVIALIPPPEPTAAAIETAPAVPTLAFASVSAAMLPAAVAQTDKPGCTQAWPYYEQSCLFNSRQPNGKTRVVRIITEDKSVANRGPRARR